MSSAYLQWSDAVIDPALWQGIRRLTLASNTNGFAVVVSVHLARPAQGIERSSVKVEGGDSRVPLPSDVIVGSTDVIEVRFPYRGDHSPYTIRLLDGGVDPLHPFFDRASFSFYIDCPSGDCRPPGTDAVPQPAKAPAIDLKTKDYRGFVQVVGDWLTAVHPQFGDRQPASFDQMLVEALCHQADLLSYYQDRVANEAFIDSARERHAMRQHGVLLGYQLDDGEAARTVLSFDVGGAGALPKGVVVDLKGAPGEAAIVFVTSASVTVDPAWNRGAMRLAAWPGASDAVVPAGSRDLLLFGHAHHLAPSQRLALVYREEAQLVTLDEVVETMLPGWVADPADLPSNAVANVTRIRFSPPTVGPITPWATTEGFAIAGNLVDAVHGQPRLAVAGPGAVPLGALQIPLTRRTATVAPQSIGAGPTRWLLRALRVPEGPVLFDRDAAGRLVPALSLSVSGEVWSRENTLALSQAFDHHYVAESDAEGRIWLQFGDGVRGAAIAVNRLDALTFTVPDSIEIRYRIGHPTAGNCAAGSLNRIDIAATRLNTGVDLTLAGIAAVTNVVAGRSGRLPEGLDHARFGIPDTLRHGPLRRAVTLADYAAAAASVDGVARAAAVDLGGIFNSVAILVDPKGRRRPPPELVAAVEARIEGLRMAGREHRVLPPVYVPIELRLAVCPASAQMGQIVRERVLQALRPGAETRPGFFHPDQLSFGQAIELGDVLAHVQSVPGVRSAKIFVFRRLGIAGVPPISAVLTMGPTEVPVLDADENRPENGILKVAVLGFDSDAAVRRDLDLPAGALLFATAGPALETTGDGQ